ncbi:MAG TPA: GTP-binding protein, partial [Spirochaetota bacterium]|nr:GTP-binding protein [Spirochaetota bacterium]
MMLKEYSTENVRTVAIVGHGSTGKSTLFDAMLFICGQIDKIGKPDDGSLTSDYDEEEKSRKISIRSALGFVEIDDVKINIIDTPGMSDFVGEARAAIQVAEAAIVVVDAVDGVQIETEKVWRYLESKKIPRIIFINKMDKERANFNAIIDNLKSHFNAKFAAVCIPVGEADKHSGIVDLIEMKAMMPKPDGKIQVSDIPADLKKAAEDARNSLMELSAEGDDALIEKYLEGEPLTEDEMKKGLKALVARAEVFPVICGSSLKAIGIKNLLNVIKNYVPAWELNKQVEGLNPNNKEEKVVITSKPDAPFAAVVWKTYIDQYAGRFNY